MKWKTLRNISLLLVLSLQGCTAMTALSFLKGLTGNQPGVAVEAQVGDRENSLAGGNTSAVGDIEVEKGTVSVDSSTKENKVGQAESVVINEGNNWLVICLVVIALLGWCLPTPAQLYQAWKK